MISKERVKAIKFKQTCRDQVLVNEIFEQIKRKEKTIMDALEEFSKFFYNKIFVIVPNKGQIPPYSELVFKV